MKKIIYILLGSFILFSCNQEVNESENMGHTEHEHTVVEAQLTLNNGAKWKADSITNNNVVYLKTIADNFRIKPSPLANEYQILGNDLNAGVNKLIQDCKMSGPDHDALHKWLEPVLKESNQLKATTDTTIAGAVFKSIDQRINDFHNYFE